MKKNVLHTKTEFQKTNTKYAKYVGIFWFLFGVVDVVYINSMGWFYMGLGVFHYALYYSIDYTIYATIENGMYKQNNWFASKTNLTKAKYVKKFAGDITFVLHNKEVRIDSQMLNQESIDAIDQFIQQNEIPCEIIPVR